MVRLPAPVRAGDEFTPRRWREFLDAIRATRILRGLGVRLKWTTEGTIITADAPEVSWAHPFQVSLRALAAATVRPGYLNASIMPTIGAKKVALDADEAPEIRLEDPLKLNADGRGWIALEVTCNAAWKAQSAEIVQVDTLDGRKTAKGETSGADAGGVAGLPGRKARHPLALLIRRENGAVDLFQVSFFNLRHVAVTKGDPKTPTSVRHYFSAA